MRSSLSCLLKILAVTFFLITAWIKLAAQLLICLKAFSAEYLLKACWMMQTGEQQNTTFVTHVAQASL